MYSVFPRRRFSLVVDCLFGTGFSGELRGKDAVAADYINASGAKVLSADIPSGVSGNSGIAAEKAVRADKTLCIGEYKAGVFLGDGIDLSGERGRADIGHFSARTFGRAKPMPFSSDGRRSPPFFRSAIGIAIRELTAASPSSRAAKPIRGRRTFPPPRRCGAGRDILSCSCPKKSCLRSFSDFPKYCFLRSEKGAGFHSAKRSLKNCFRFPRWRSEWERACPRTCFKACVIF